MKFPITMKALGLSAAVALAPLMASGAQAAGTLTTAVAIDPGSWDPIDTFLVDWSSAANNIFDGLTALVSAPETAPQIVGIVIGSTFKGIVVGALAGWFANRVQSTAAGIVAGLLLGAAFAFLVAVMPSPDGKHYYWEIILPGSVLGMIVGYATQRYGQTPQRQQRQTV